MDDLISRQAAIEALHTWFKDGFEEDRWWNSTHVLAAIEGLPSAQPERKRGKWKRAYLDHEAMGERPSILYCSVCNQCIAYPVNYCPNCGARMEGEKDG